MWTAPGDLPSFWIYLCVCTFFPEGLCIILTKIWRETTISQKNQSISGLINKSLMKTLKTENLFDFICANILQIYLILEAVARPFSLERERYIYICIHGCMCAQSLQSCLTLWDLMDCSPLDSSVHGIFLERISEWVSIPSSRGSSWLRDGTHVSSSPKLQVDSLLFESLGKAPNMHGFLYKNLQNLKYIFYLSCKILL